MPPRRAPVRPRVFCPHSGVALPLDDEICELVPSGNWDAVALIGPRGSGKTTALEHLQHVLPADARIVLLDEPTIQQVVRCHRVVFSTPDKVPGLIGYKIYRLAPWTADEFVEYLLAVHKDQCASVMARLPAEDRGLFDGLPEVWRIILDQLAADEAIQGAPGALRCYLQMQLPDTDLVERARSACLNILAAAKSEENTTSNELSKPGFPRGLLRVLRHRAVQVQLASERMAADLGSDSKCDYLALRLPRDLVERTAAVMFHDGKALERLQQLLAGPAWSHAMAASILHATKSAAVPQLGLTELAGAYLDAIKWPGAVLANAKLAETDLSNANLRGADLSGADATGADLSAAFLQGACLQCLTATSADLSHADLGNVRAERAKFLGANLEGANLDDSQLHGVCFVGARLTRASFRGATLTGADLVDADIKKADFAGADLEWARFMNQPLREAILAGASFRNATLSGCDLEYVEFPQGDFECAFLEDALLTGSIMRRASFRKANLRNAKLAEVDWEGADLRDADLSGATFHMGTTRSGLVGSLIPCEGSKTGFYTDDYHEQNYKAPEEIRKANLCGADLRGAKIENVDFYLVDLRDAKFDHEQAGHLFRCGAILEAR